MSTKPVPSVLIGFLAGIGVAVVIGWHFWAPDASDRPTPIPVDVETVAEAASAADRRALPVDETETLVADDEPIVEPSPEPDTNPTVARREPVSSSTSSPPPVREPVREPAAEPRPEPEVIAAERAEPVERPAAAARADRDAERVGEPGEPASNDDAWARSDPWPEEPAGRETLSRDRAMAEPGTSRPVAPREPAGPTFEDLILSADSVISLQVDSSISTETALVEDRVEARTLRDVKVGSETAIPAGTRALGSVTLVEMGGKIKERARLGIRFHTLVLDDGTEVPLQTETIYREGQSPGKESTAKIGGGAAAGAILGGIFGGRRGAVIGGAIGAGGGTAATMAGGRNPATLPAGTPVTIRLQAPATVTVER
jgi:type IV secretory pathway VirB10-like protein